MYVGFPVKVGRNVRTLVGRCRCAYIEYVGRNVGIHLQEGMNLGTLLNRYVCY